MKIKRRLLNKESLAEIEYKGVITMISIIIGNKGSGKTKKLIENINARVNESHGNVVCIEKGMKLT